MKLPVVKIPDPILRAKALPVKKVTPELVALARNMLQTMKSNNGIGLAAPQIGQSIRLFVTGLDLEKGDEERHTIPETILFNPEIIRKSKTKAKMTEGCLSIPGLTGVVERAASVTVTGLSEKGKKVTIAAEGLYARVMQHEIDHLNGVLFTDRLATYNVVFYGTSEFAVPALSALAGHPQFNVVAVVTETDKPAGRGHTLQSSPVKQVALALGLSVLQPETLRTDHKDGMKAKDAKVFMNDIEALAPDFQIVASYGKILPQAVLDLPRYVSINIHPSLLPKYRGATPIQSAILNGETKTGIAIMEMSAEMDAGAIISMYEYKISPTETAGDLTTRLAEGARIQLLLALEDIISDKAEVWTQNAEDATYTEKIETGDAHIDWSKPARDIVNLIRAMSPKPGAYTEVDGHTIKVLRAHLDQNHIVLDEVLIPGKKPMTMTDLKNGYKAMYNQLIAIIK